MCFLTMFQINYSGIWNTPNLYLDPSIRFQICFVYVFEIKFCIILNTSNIYQVESNVCVSNETYMHYATPLSNLDHSIRFQIKYIYIYGKIWNIYATPLSNLDPSIRFQMCFKSNVLRFETHQISSSYATLLHPSTRLNQYAF